MSFTIKYIVKGLLADCINHFCIGVGRIACYITSCTARQRDIFHINIVQQNNVSFRIFEFTQTTSTGHSIYKCFEVCCSSNASVFDDW